MLIKYKAKNKEGEITEGEMEVRDKLDLGRRLRTQGYYILDMNEIEGEEREGDKKTSALKNLGSLDLNLLKEKVTGVSLEEKMMFSRNLSVMIDSGINITRALKVLNKQTQSPTLRKTIDAIAQDIKKGSDLSKAMAKHPAVFDTLYVSMVKAGEASGNLNEALEILSDQLEKDHDLRSRVKGALTYPSVVVVAMIGIGALMLVSVVPQLQEVFEDLGAELPATTQFIIFLSEFLQHFWWTFLIVLPVAAYGLKRFLSTSRGKRTLSMALLYLPIFKGLTKKINNARFARTLSSLNSGGVPILESLNITSDTMGNMFYKNSVLDAAEEVKKGENIYKALSKHKELYTPLLLEMVEVGEEAGKLSDLLERVAAFYEGEVADATENLSSIIEPIIMVLIGGTVGFFAISVMQPIYGTLGAI